MKEDIIQQQIIGYLSVTARKHNFIYFAPLNESTMSVMNKFRVPKKSQYMIMAWMSKMGFLPGISDLIIMKDGKVYCVELKTSTGRQSKSQILFQDNCKRCSVPYAIARSLEDAQGLLKVWGIVG